MSYGLFGESGKLDRLRQLKRWAGALGRAGALRRTIDSKPIWAQLNITQRCNLDCGYCVEHTKQGRDVRLADVRRWIDHCHGLGVRHLEFIGGEPLLHPHLNDMLAQAQQLGMNTGLTTNGFLLKHHDMRRLIGLGVKRLQLSVDCIEPNDTTRKALSLLRPALEQLRHLPVWFRVNTLIVDATIDETRALATALFDLNVPVSFAPGHVHGRLKIENPTPYVELFDWLKEQKARGKPVDMPRFLLDYYRDNLVGSPICWKCEGGCKAFYVDADGYFRHCSHSQANQPLEEVTAETLTKNHQRRKGCEDGCGVQCMILTSLPFNRLGYVLAADYCPAVLRRLFRSNSTDQRLSPADSFRTIPARPSDMAARRSD